MTEGVGPFRLLLAADPASSDSGGPTVIIVVAVLTVLGTVATAMGPTLVEIVKGRSSRKATPVLPVAPTISNDPQRAGAFTRPHGDALDLVEQAVFDYRAQRDTALADQRSTAYQLTLAQQTITQQAVTIARMEAEIANLRNQQSANNQDAYGRHRPQNDGPYDDPYRSGNWRRS